MSELKILGSITHILPIQTGTSKTNKEWSKQDFVIQTEGQYPKPIMFTLFGEKTSLIQGFIIGSQVEVYFNLESREHDGKWYSQVNAWKVDFKGTQSSQSNNTATPNKPDFGVQNPPNPIDDNNWSNEPPF